MKEFIKKKGIYVAIAAVAVAIIAAITTAFTSGGASFVSILSEPFFKPVKSVVTSTVSSLEQLYGYMYKYDEISAENEELRKRVADLEEEYREYTEISNENRRLRSLLGFNERHSSENFEYCSTSVISWTASNFASSFTINKGSSSGVEKYDCVVTEDGYLVGQVTSVTASSATVVSILDTTMSFGAVVYESGETGIVEGDFDLLGDSLLRLGYLGDSANIIIGNAVMTSGQGGTCPEGLVIGYVDSIAENPSGLDYHAVIRPAADINNISHLYVITDFVPGE